MNKPLVLCTYFMEGFLLYDVFIDVSWLFHPQYHKYLPFFMTALSAHVVLSVLYSTFPTLSKLTYSTYSFKIIWGEMNLFSWGISNSVPQFTSSSCNCGNHSVIVFSFTTTQSKIKKTTHRAEAHLTFYFSLPIYISINCPDILGKFYTGFALPCNP